MREEVEKKKHLLGCEVDTTKWEDVERAYELIVQLEASKQLASLQTPRKEEPKNELYHPERLESFIISL